MDFTDIYRTLHPNANEYTFFSSSHGTFSRIDHIPHHNSGLNRFQKIGIVPCIFSDCNALKLELNHNKKFGRISNMRKLRIILLKGIGGDWVMATEGGTWRNEHWVLCYMLANGTPIKKFP